MTRAARLGCLLAALLVFPHGVPAQERTPVERYRDTARGLELVQVGSGQSAFHVMSTLIVGPTESILWDAQYKLSDGRRLADSIAATGTRLTAIVLSHADHDHYMGAPGVLERFPGTPVYMSRAGLEDFRERSSRDLEAEKKRGDAVEVPDRLFTPQPLPAARLLVDGHELEVIDGLTGDVRGPVSTALWIPDLRTVLAGDLVFEGVHPWLGDADRASRVAWRASLERLAALDPVAVVSGHKRDLSAPDTPEQIAFMAAS